MGLSILSMAVLERSEATDRKETATKPEAPQWRAIKVYQNLACFLLADGHMSMEGSISGHLSNLCESFGSGGGTGDGVRFYQQHLRS